MIAIIALAGIAIGTNIIGTKILVRTTNKEFEKDLEFYRALVSVPKNTPTGEYSCTLTMSQTEKTFFLRVK